MNDQANIENRNAGNGGDLMKHTVYLVTLRFLLGHEPWRQGLRLRECHAGRGIYDIPEWDARRRLLSCFYANPLDKNAVLLQRAQRNILGRLGCEPDGLRRLKWYVGSSLINVFTSADQHG